MKKVNDMLKDICRTLYEGLGKPEELKGTLSGKWSRRLNGKDRIVYSIDDNEIIIYQCKGHYSD